jgi:hypothetical protein
VKDISERSFRIKGFYSILFQLRFLLAWNHLKPCSFILFGSTLHGFDVSCQRVAVSEIKSLNIFNCSYENEDTSLVCKQRGYSIIKFLLVFAFDVLLVGLLGSVLSGRIE